MGQPADALSTPVVLWKVGSVLIWRLFQEEKEETKSYNKECMRSCDGCVMNPKHSFAFLNKTG